LSLSDFQTYGEFIYTLPERYPIIQRSTLVLATIGPTLAKLEGQLTFEQRIILDVWELVDFDRQQILKYSYEIYNSDEKICWYDPFEHPNVPELSSTYPHHKHLPPDIKHHRVPASGIRFERPNLPYLIEEIQREFLPH
jgi:hypothetical protein